MKRGKVELRRRGVTLALLWGEYRAGKADGCGYSRFCDLYGEAIMRAKPHAEQGFRSCLGILSLARAYAGAVAGWDLHPLKSAALSRRTPLASGLWKAIHGHQRGVEVAISLGLVEYMAIRYRADQPIRPESYRNQLDRRLEMPDKFQPSLHPGGQIARR